MKISWKPFTAEERKKQLEGNVSVVTTFRKGDKWCKAENIGQEVEFVDEADNSIFAVGVIQSAKICAFKDINTLDHSHQSNDMTKEARLGVMQKVYGEYTEDTLTTVVTINKIQIV